MDFKALPKIDLHCHLDGGVRASTIIDLAQKEGIDLPTTKIDEMKKVLTAPESCTSLPEYLERFDLPNKVMQTKEGLKRIAFELLEDAAKENVKYIEVRYAPLLHTNKGLSIEEIIESVVEGIKEAEALYDIKGNIILSFLRIMPKENIKEVLEVAKKYLNHGVVAVDLAANEEADFAKEYVDILAVAKEMGFRVTIHAGETGVGMNVYDAVTLLGAERIGHGIAIKDCKKAYDLVKQEGITLEICPTSNVQTKGVNSIAEHPINEFYRGGLKVTINTDNRTVSDTTMTEEIKKVCTEFKLGLNDYKKIYTNSIEAAFIDDEGKRKLLTYLNG